MLGVKIGTIHTYNDWGLILSSKIISPPEPQLKMLTVPMRDGSLDLTEALTDEIKYKDRKITLTFTVVDPVNVHPSKVSMIKNYLQGQRLPIVFDDDIAFYYIGRAKVSKWTTKKNIGTLVIECTVEPFKYDVLSSAVDWEWDVFDFEEGIINETGELIVNGTRTITLICRRKRMFPTFTASANMTVKYDGETYNLKAGTQKMYDIFLCEGNNELTFAGNGTVSIEYTGGSL